MIMKCKDFDQPSIIARGATMKLVQEVLADASCQSLPVFLTMTEFYNCILLIISYHFYTEEVFKGQTSVQSASYILLCVSTAIMTIREIVEILANGLNWFGSIWNYFDVVTISLVITSIIKSQSEDIQDNFGTLVVFTTAFVWIDVVFFLRSTFVSFAVFVSGIFKILGDLVPFVVISFFVLVAYADMLKLESFANHRCEESTTEGGDNHLPTPMPSAAPVKFCSLEDSLFSTYGFFVGGMDVEGYAESPLMMGISISFTFLGSVILLNVVIAILSTSWETVTGNSVILVSIDIYVFIFQYLFTFNF